MASQSNPDAKIFVYGREDFSDLKEVFPQSSLPYRGNRQTLNKSEAEAVVRRVDYSGVRTVEFVRNKRTGLPKVGNAEYRFTEVATGEHFSVPIKKHKGDRESHYRHVAEILEKRANKNNIKKGTLNIIIL